MTESQQILTPHGVAHHGPVTVDCPVECLRTVLSRSSWNPLARAADVSFSPPRTVGDVVGLCTGGRLREIGGIGRRRISEIQAALVVAGFDITAKAEQPGVASEVQP